jgi:hypothetical protein
MHRLAIALLAGAAASAQAGNADCPDLTMLQRAAGAVTWTSFLQVSGIGLAVAGVLLFCSGFVRRFLQQVRLIEALLWTATAGLAVGGLFLPTSWQLWAALAACLLFPGAAALTIQLRKIAMNTVKASQVLALVWGAMALLYQQQVLGFLAVLAVIALLGFSMAIMPFCYCFGFRDRQSLFRAPVGGALLVLGFAGLTVLGLSAGVFEVFRAGALWLGSLTWFLGLLIVSHRYFGRHGGLGYGLDYVTNQAVTIVSLVGALALGHLYAIGELVTMASTFLLFYLGSKVIEIPIGGRMGLGVRLMLASGVVTGAWYASQKYLVLAV